MNRSLGESDTTNVDTQKDTGCLEGLRGGPHPVSRVHVEPMQEDDAKVTNDAFQVIRHLPTRVYVAEEV